jgi:outer membrane protein assembly factor BamA
LRLVLLILGTFPLCVPNAFPQDTTRAKLIEQARDLKASRLTPDEPSTWERRLIYIKDAKVLERISYGIAGVRVGVGQMGTGGGFALGPDYFREDLARGEVSIHAGAYASTRQWTKLLAEVSAPHFARNMLFWNLGAVHHNYNSIPYYGSGPSSEKTARSNYRYEDFAADTAFGIQPLPFLKAGVSAGHLRMNVGPGSDSRYISSEFAFPLTVGIQQQTNFRRWGSFLQIDYRDSPTGPRSGGYYVVNYDDYHDSSLGLHSFRRLDAEAHQFIPFFNKRRVIALRGRTALSYPDRNQAVPFYLQSVLGGSEDMRGFRPYRFYDNNLFVMNAEYRWEIFSGLDGALFADAGKVFARRGDLNFDDLESSVGFGLRFNVRNAPFLRLDVGFSHEGFQVWMKFGGNFASRPYAFSHGSFIR